jgi:hypothetical protein
MMHPQEPLLLAIGAIILGLVLAWGIFRNRRRNRANDRIGDAAAREQYQHPNSYDPEKYRAQLGPKS